MTFLAFVRPLRHHQIYRIVKFHLQIRSLFNLLDDPLFDAVVDGKLGRYTLPEVIARLLDARLTELRGVSAIQRQFVWRLLVRCAAFAARAWSWDAAASAHMQWLREGPA